MRGLSLFTGIGGLDLAAEAAGISIAAMCEIEPFCVNVLGKRWPDMPVIDDVKNIHGGTVDGPVDIVFGGFPCQDLSVAKSIDAPRRGLEGDRSGLWFEMERVIREVRPYWVLAENVRGAVNLALDAVKAGMEDAGYQVWPFVIPAAAFGAPHKRERMFVIGARADAVSAIEGKSASLEYRPCGSGESIPRPNVARECGGELEGQLNPDWLEILMGFPEGWTDIGRDEPRPWQGFPAPMSESRNWATPCSADCVGSRAPGMGRSIRNDIYLVKKGEAVCPQYAYEPPRVAKGVKMRKERLKSLGNAVVPQQAYPLFKAIAEMHKEAFE